jgi:hypothetical protein
MLIDIYKHYRDLDIETLEGDKKEQKLSKFKQLFNDEMKSQGYVYKDGKSKGKPLKSGPFAEKLMEEVITSSGFSFKKSESIAPNSILTSKNSFKPDGYIEEFDVYLESKNYWFHSSGTANEKLYGFLAKVPHYDKPVILVLQGEHEKRLHDECRSIWEIYHDNPEFDEHIFSSPIKKLRDEGKLLLTTILELSDFLKEMQND